MRVSTTVDEGLLADARRISGGQPDAVLIDEALRSLLLRHGAAELDAEYTAYDVHPVDEPDEWGDLATFRAGPGQADGPTTTQRGVVVRAAADRASAGRRAVS